MIDLSEKHRDLKEEEKGEALVESKIKDVKNGGSLVITEYSK